MIFKAKRLALSKVDNFPVKSIRTEEKKIKLRVLYFLCNFPTTSSDITCKVRKMVALAHSVRVVGTSHRTTGTVPERVLGAVSHIPKDASRTGTSGISMS